MYIRIFIAISLQIVHTFFIHFKLEVDKKCAQRVLNFLRETGRKPPRNRLRNPRETPEKPPRNTSGKPPRNPETPRETPEKPPRNRRETFFKFLRIQGFQGFQAQSGSMIQWIIPSFNVPRSKSRGCMPRIQAQAANPRLQSPGCKVQAANPRLQIPGCKTQTAKPRLQNPGCKENFVIKIVCNGARSSANVHDLARS